MRTQSFFEGCDGSGHGPRRTIRRRLKWFSIKSGKPTHTLRQSSAILLRCGQKLKTWRGSISCPRRFARTSNPKRVAAEARLFLLPVEPAPHDLIHPGAHFVVLVRELARVPELADDRPVVGADRVRLASAVREGVVDADATAVPIVNSKSERTDGGDRQDRHRKHAASRVGFSVGTGAGNSELRRPWLQLAALSVPVEMIGTRCRPSWRSREALAGSRSGLPCAADLPMEVVLHQVAQGTAQLVPPAWPRPSIPWPSP